MFLFFIIFFGAVFKLCACEEFLKNEAELLTELFFENLKADSCFYENTTGIDTLTGFSKNLIEKRVENFVNTLSKSQNTQISRQKRSLAKNTELTNGSSYIQLTNFPDLPLNDLIEVQAFNQSNSWFLATLRGGFNFSIYQVTHNENISLVFTKTIKNITNLATLPNNNSTIFVLQKPKNIEIFEFYEDNQNRINFEKTQELNISANHFQAWHDISNKFLSITKSRSEVWLYTWRGRHFDRIQKIQTEHVQKTLAFNINGVQYLVLIKTIEKLNVLEGEKLYSEIYKLNLDSMKFEIYEKLFTPQCKNFKFFKSVSNKENQYFLINQESKSTILYKFVENYFIPFQSWEVDAYEIQPIQNEFQNTALLVFTDHKVKGFLYDDWYFSETEVLFDKYPTNLRPNIVHTFKFEGKYILLLSCKNCSNNLTVFSLNFNSYNELQKLHLNLLSWCEDSLEEIDSNDEYNYLVSESLRGDLNEEVSHSEQEELNKVSAALSKSDIVLFEIEEKLNEKQNFNASEFFNKPVNAENLIFNKEVTTANLETKNINDVELGSLLDNAINITQGFQLKDSTLDFETLTVENEMQPEILNGQNKNNYLTIFDDLDIKNLEVSGKIVFDNNVKVENDLNNLSISKANLMVNNEEQHFDYNFTLKNVEIKNLTTRFLNGLNMDNYKNLSNQNHVKIFNLDKLEVANIKIGGLLNKVSVPVLDQQCLKKSGEQKLNKTYYFNTLEVSHLEVVEDVSGKKIPDDFVLINTGEFVVNQDVIFNQDLSVNKFEVLTSLNNITVNDDGNLDILLKNSSKIQFLPTKKIFKDLVLMNPMKLRNKIQNKQLEDRSLVRLETNNLEITKNIKIEGNVDVKKLVKAKNIFESLENESIGKILEHGIKLTDKRVPVELNFLKPLVLDEIFVEKISDFVPENWLLKSSTEVQLVKGTKTFENLSLQGSTVVENLNNIDTVQFWENVLKINEDQEVFGKLEFDFIACENGTIAKEVNFGSHPWEDVITFNENRTTIFENVRAKSIRVTNSTKVYGFFNNENITSILKNVALKNPEMKILGNTQIKHLHIDDLTYVENNCVKNLLDTVSNNSLEINKNNLFIRQIESKNIFFQKFLNNISKEQFDELNDFGSNQSLEIAHDVILNSLAVDGKIFIENNRINDVNLTEIEKETVKIDENHSFKDVIVETGIIVKNNLKVNGNIENLDLDNIFDPDFECILQNKVFLTNVEIKGNVNIDTLLNNAINITDFCRMAAPNENERRNLEINGSAIIAKGMGILNVNNIDISDLAQTIWISDREIVLKGNLTMSDAVFEKELNINGFVNNENLTEISENYFSKTKNQTVKAQLLFDNGVIFEKNISTPKLKLGGKINGVSLDEFVRVVLLNGVDQFFEDGAYFEEVITKNVANESDFLINNLNLATDIMRYDQENIVTGHKVFENLNITFFKNSGKNIKVQNVDLEDFVENAVLKNGNFIIGGTTKFEKAIFKNGISVKGFVNSKKFTSDTLLVKDIPQTINGKISFAPEEGQEIRFKALKTQGLVNDLNIYDMTKNQVQNTGLTTIDSNMEFEKNIVTNNIVFEDLCNNVNVSELLIKFSKVEALENFVENYNNLLDISVKIEESFNNQALVFQHFKEIQSFSNTYNSFGLQNHEGYFIMLIFSFYNGTNYYRSFEWIPQSQEFVYIGEFIESYAHPYFMDQIKFYNRDFLYIEHHTNQLPPILQGNSPFTGRLIQLENSTTMAEIALFPTNGTISITSLCLPRTNQACFAFVESNMRSVNILCDENGVQQSYYLFDRIELEGVIKISAVSTSKSTYLFAKILQTSLNQEPHIVILEKTAESQSFKVIQAIFEAGEPVEFAHTVFNEDVFLAVTYASREINAVDFGRISIRKLNSKTNQFLPWQYIPLPAPLDVKFVSSSYRDTEKDEPMLIVTTNDADCPLYGARYDGLAGFREDFRGRSLSSGLSLRVLNEDFLIAFQPNNLEATVLKAKYKGH